MSATGFTVTAGHDDAAALTIGGDETTVARVSGVDELRVDDDDWFGEGSKFDSGEDLAAALFSLGASHPPGNAEGASDPTSRGHSAVGLSQGTPQAEPASSGTSGGRDRPGGIPGFSGAGEFSDLLRSSPAGRAGDDASSWPTITARPQSGAAIPPGAPRSGPGWRIRQGVRSLRQAEEALEKLREDAIAVTWAAASVATRRARRDP